MRKIGYVIGIRAQLLYKFNDDWDVLLAQSYQDMHSQGVFYQQPNASDGAPLQPLEVTLFNPQRAEQAHTVHLRSVQPVCSSRRETARGLSA